MIQELPAYDPAIASEFGIESLTTGPMFMGAPLFDEFNFWLLILRFAFNLLVCWIIIQFLYYKKSRRKDFYFTFMLFSVAVFLLIFLMDSVSIQLGFALGLFAIFGIIRYRTETVPIREMTYLFVVIGISLINGLSGTTISHIEILATNLLFILVVWALESNRLLKHTSHKIVLYEKIQLIKPEKHNELLSDLKERTGLDITKLEIGHIDFLRDVAYIKVYYNSDSDEINTIDTITRFR
jgi:lipid-A-disaccharide synthase-like uncharacterized protein